MDTKKILKTLGPARLGLLAAAGVLLLLLFRTDEKGNRSAESSDGSGWFLEEENRDSSREDKLKKVLEQTEGVGKAEVIITSDTEEKTEGIVVVCEGGESAGVQKKIAEAVQVLFPLPSHKIKVMKMKSKG